MNSATNTATESTANSAIDTAIITRTLIATAFADQEWALMHGLTVRDAITVAAFQRKLFVGPRAALQWKPLSQLSASGSYSRLYQYAQSLRNEESVAANIFPADLFVGADTVGVPVARSDQYELGADYHPSGGLHIGANVYQRRLHGTVMVAPRNGEPFAVRGFLVGGSASRGLVFDVAMSGARYAVQSSYGYQRVTYSHIGSTYTPDFGATHSFDGGAIIFPTATSSIRFGVSAQAGRRTTAVIGPFEWEACNLRDRGCEFSGTPRVATEMLGQLKLPFYLRADLGIRKHWHVDIGRRNVEVALFGSATNVFGRRNLLTLASVAASNALSPVEMRPFAPLVIGFEWHF